MMAENLMRAATAPKWAFEFASKLVGIRDIEFEVNDQVKDQVVLKTTYSQETKDRFDRWLEEQGVADYRKNMREFNRLMTNMTKIDTPAGNFYAFPTISRMPIGVTPYFNSFFLLNPREIRNSSNKNLVRIQIPLGYDVFQDMSPIDGGENETLTLTGTIFEVWLDRILKNLRMFQLELFALSDAKSESEKIQLWRAIQLATKPWWNIYPSVYDYLSHLKEIFDLSRAVEVRYPFYAPSSGKRFTGEVFYGYITRFEISETGGKPDRVDYSIEVTRSKRIEKTLTIKTKKETLSGLGVFPST